MGVDEEKVKGFTPTWTTITTSKLCDSCKSATANLFCRPDSAFLCIPCDSKIHAVNKFASRHARVWMCEVCEQAPSHVTCKADAAALCITCDRDIHSANPLARRHKRFPVTPFYDSAVVPNHHHEEEGEHHFSGINNNGICNLNNVVVDEIEEEEEDAEEATSWLIPNPTDKMIGSPEPAAPLTNYNLYSDIDPYLDLEYGSMDTKFQPQPQQERQKNQEEQKNSGTTDGVVPVQSKNPHVNQGSFVNGGGSESCFDFDFMRSKAFPYYNNNAAQSLSQSVSSSSHDVGVVPDGGPMIDVSNPFCRQYSNVSDVVNQTAVQVPGIDREARVLRYREKRKNRKFEKTIRYASRKAYAETRPRVKGRFAKRSEIDVEVDQIYGSSPALMAAADAGYGVVPTF